MEAATKTERTEQAKERIDHIDVRAARDEIERGNVRLIDVRERHEWDESHLEGATLVPELTVADRIGEVVPDRSRAGGPLLPHRQPVRARSRRAARARLRGRGLRRGRDRRLGGGGASRSPPTRASPPTSGLATRATPSCPRSASRASSSCSTRRSCCIGAGGLGSPSALYLAAAGVGTIGIVDDDLVDESNLQRQIIHSTERVGDPKTASAKVAIEGLNPDVEVVEHRMRLDSSNILEILEPYDIVVDGADNFPTRYLLNDASVRLRKPVVSASILGFDGQISTFVPYEGPCYRCLYPTPPPPELAPSCSANGVLGVMAGVMGLLQANEVIKLAAGIGEPLVGRLLLYEALGTRFTELKVPPRPGLPDLRPERARGPRLGAGEVPRLRGLLRRPGPRRLTRPPAPSRKLARRCRR